MQNERSERRASPRHRIALPILLGEARGATRDVNASGMYFTVPRASAGQPRLHERIRFQVTLEHADAQGQLHIGCDGHIVRIETGSEGIGMAVRVDSYDFGTSEGHGRAAFERTVSQR